MTEAIVKKDNGGFTDEQINDIVQQGDVSGLDPKQRSIFLSRLAEYLKLNPFSKPFDLIQVKKPDGSKKMIIYANRAAADQIRERDGISVELVSEGPLQIGEAIRDDIYVVRMKIKGEDKNGNLREEPSVGSVSLAGLSGDDLANAIMKCHTKAARRGTLSFAGLGFPDESEVSSIPGIVSEPSGGAGRPKVIEPSIPSANGRKPLPRAEDVVTKPPVKVMP
ncbi:MAG: hypothetical protein GTO63_15540 [Anaerolineae bacterium]|nr:hypothetical protein [Anaerolineae bacterium]NIN96242.1 hypothetical protein [Anaerolineae bacterium]NIQ79262.1 hypothetical protein [Anaerolineae bacterium]